MPLQPHNEQTDYESPRIGVTMSTVHRHKHKAQPHFVESTPLNDAVHDCIQIAMAAESPAAAVYEFVQALIHERSWNEADANELGRRAIGVVNSLSGRSGTQHWG